MTATDQKTGPRDVSQTQPTKPIRRRKASVSPEIQEVLNMLKSLETELASPPSGGR